MNAPFGSAVTVFRGRFSIQKAQCPHAEIFHQMEDRGVNKSSHVEGEINQEGVGKIVAERGYNAVERQIPKRAIAHELTRLFLVGLFETHENACKNDLKAESEGAEYEKHHKEFKESCGGKRHRVSLCVKELEPTQKYTCFIFFATKKYTRNGCIVLDYLQGSRFSYFVSFGHVPSGTRHSVFA